MSSVPIVHRLLRRLGSFPFHTSSVVTLLTFDVFCCAIINITFRDWDLSGRHPEYSPETQDSRFRRLLFQSLMLPSTTGYSYFTTATENDENVVEALTMIKKYNRWSNPEHPKISYEGPKLPPASSFPNSGPSSLSGTVSIESIDPLITLLLLIQLSPEKLGPDKLASRPDDLRRAAAAMGNGLVMHKRSGTAGIIWDGFEIGFRDYFVRISQSLVQSFTDSRYSLNYSSALIVCSGPCSTNAATTGNLSPKILSLATTMRTSIWLPIFVLCKQI